MEAEWPRFVAFANWPGLEYGAALADRKWVLMYAHPFSSFLLTDFTSLIGGAIPKVYLSVVA